MASSIALVAVLAYGADFSYFESQKDSWDYRLALTGLLGVLGGGIHGLRQRKKLKQQAELTEDYADRFERFQETPSAQEV